jgi:hypothetical protein
VNVGTVSLEAALENFSRASLDDGAKKNPLLLIDEFTTLYFPEASTSGVGSASQSLRTHGSSIMKELHQFAKMHTNVAALLTASKTCVERYIYPDSRDFEGYPNLNNSIYIRRDMRPIRDPIILADYAQKRYPGWEIDGNVLLDATGGVGRFVANFRANSSWHPDFKAQEVLSSRALFDLCCAMLSHVPASALTSASWPVGIGIALTAAVQLLRDHGIDANSFIDKWCDALFFHRSDSCLEFLIPASARKLHEAISSNEELSMARVLSTILNGFHGGDPGHSNEDLICRYIHRSANVKFTTGNVLQLGSATTPGATWAEPSGASNTAVLDKTTLNTLMKWRFDGSEKGVDRIWLTDCGPHPTSGRRRVQIDGLQLKTGKRDRKITAGVLESQRRLTMVNIDDNTIAGILVKAERGFAALVQALHRAFPEVTFALGDFCIYTTKLIDEAVESFLKGNPLTAEKFSIREQEASQIRASGAVDVTLPVQFTWSAHGGTDWLRDILPEHVAALVL